MGYVLLGALVTRLGILFTGSGPMAEVKGRGGKDIKWLVGKVRERFGKKKTPHS